MIFQMKPKPPGFLKTMVRLIYILVYFSAAAGYFVTVIVALYDIGLISFSLSLDRCLQIKRKKKTRVEQPMNYNSITC